MIGGFFKNGVYRKIILSIIGIIQTEIIDIIGKGAGASKTTTTLIGDTITEVFDIGDELFLNWVLPVSIDLNKDPTISLSLAPTGSEAGKKVSFDVSILSSKPGVDISTTTGTVQFIDKDITDIVNIAFTAEESISAQTFLDSDMNTVSLHLKIKRVASSADPAANIALYNAQISYNIK